MKLFILFLALLNIMSIFSMENLPEEKMNVTQIIQYQGYPWEEHSAITKDGYILGIQRIPYGKGQKYSSSRPVVMLQHGVLDAATTWLVNPPKESLAFIMADAGYDVWLPNSRGSYYSDKNIHYSTSDAQFWDFSFDQMASLDIPASIDLILNVTKHESLYYVGHSQGTLIAFCGFSENQEYAAKIKKLVALAPIGSVSHIKGIPEVLATFRDVLEDAAALIDLNDVLPSDEFIRILGRTECGGPANWLCAEVAMLVCGPDWNNLNRSRLGVYLSHWPDGTSRQNLIHYGQGYANGGVSKYDYGTTGNKQHYGTDTPPAYNLSNYAVPTGFISGTNDYLADPTDVDWLRGQIPNALKMDVVIDGWDHLSFVWGMDAYEKGYPKILSFFSED